MNLRQDGTLLRTWKDGVAKFNGYLEDYSFLIEGLVTLFETTGEFRWLKEALALTVRMIEEFWDEDAGGFFFTGKSHENLIVRSKDYFDNATPSGNSVAAFVCAQAGDAHGKETTIGTWRPLFARNRRLSAAYPSGFGYALSAVDFLLSTPKEMAIVGSDPVDIEPYCARCGGTYLPNKVVAPGLEVLPFHSWRIRPLNDRANRVRLRTLHVQTACK